MNLSLIILIFLLGISIGSFLNVCIYRIPLGKSIVSPPSACPGCGERIKAFDLIPIFSYIFLRGKCRNCGTHISVRYSMVELLTGLLFTALFIKFGISVQFIMYAAFTSLLIAIFFIDFDHMIIPDGMNLAIALLGITLNIIYPLGGYKTTLLGMLYGFLIGGGFFFILAYFGAMGGGDIKLMAALGLLFGWKLTLLTMFLSFILGGIVGITLIAVKAKKMKDMIPFGPYIACASVIVIFFGSQMINWYFGKFFTI